MKKKYLALLTVLRNGLRRFRFRLGLRFGFRLGLRGGGVRWTSIHIRSLCVGGLSGNGGRERFRFRLRLLFRFGGRPSSGAAPILTT